MIDLNDLELRSEKLPSDGSLLESNVRYSWVKNGLEIATVTIEKWANDWTSCHSLFVRKDYRRNGIGSQIVKFAIAKGVNNLSVDPDNKNAIHIYLKSGFKFSGFYDGKLKRMTL